MWLQLYGCPTRMDRQAQAPSFFRVAQLPIPTERSCFTAIRRLAFVLHVAYSNHATSLLYQLKRRSTTSVHYCKSKPGFRAIAVSNHHAYYTPLIPNDLFISTGCHDCANRNGDKLKVLMDAKRRITGGREERMRGKNPLLYCTSVRLSSD